LNRIRWVGCVLFLGLAWQAFAQADGLGPLRAGFKDPPSECRIMMRWWWFGPIVTKPELERELRAMKQGGIGGVEVQPVYPLALDDPLHGFHNFPYLSDEFIDRLRFASNKARELGLRFDITLGSGWPFGGPHIPVTQAAGKRRVVSVPVGPETHSVAAPSISAGEELLAAFLTDDSQLSSSEMQNLSGMRNARLTLSTSTQSRTLLWFIASRTGMTVKRPAIGAEGFVLDHFDQKAIENHLHAVGNRLFTAFEGSPPYAIFSDSLEVYGSDWTGDLLQEFRKRRGYDLTPYLPALVDDIGPKTADIRHDWGKTLTELADENYLSPLREWAARHGTRFRSQTYGIPPVTLSSNSLVDLPEGEGDQWRKFTSTRWASSASHLYGKNITSAETWTWLHSPAFRATPLDMKAEADLFFLQGINQIVGHGWPYSPPGISEPGWNFYAAAAFNDHNPWWPVMPDVARYLQRVSYVLRQGKPANDVAVLLPTDDAWAEFTAGKDSVSESMERLLGPDLIPQILDAGLNFDFIDAAAIDRIGVQYPLLILPDVKRLPLATYRKVEQYAQKGGLVVATRGIPSFAPGLLESQTDTRAIQQISQSLFSSSSAKGYLVSDERQLSSFLTRHFTADISTSPGSPVLGFVHRKLPSADVYFLANTSNRSITTTATFRVPKEYAEWWDPFTGEISPVKAGQTLELRMQPYESRILVFADQPPLSKSRTEPRREDQIIPLSTDLDGDWTVTFPLLHRTIQMEKLRSWTDDAETRFYSGSAIYERDFMASVSPNLRAYLDFGPGTVVEPQRSDAHFRALLESPVREAAQVFVNGQPAGPIWKPPYKVEVTTLLHGGQNHLKIIVYNLAINVLSGRELPDYRLLDSRYGQRFVPQDMNNLQPLPSGLLSTPQLVMEKSR
jgi:hypothetical protein